MRVVWNVVRVTDELRALGIVQPGLLIQNTEADPEFIHVTSVTPNYGRLLGAEMDGALERCDITGHVSVSRAPVAARQRRRPPQRPAPAD